MDGAVGRPRGALEKQWRVGSVCASHRGDLRQSRLCVEGIACNRPPARSPRHVVCRDRPDAPRELARQSGVPSRPTGISGLVAARRSHRAMVFPKGKLVAQTEDVLVDSRGYIYITDKNQGLYILKYTGK